MNGNRLSAARLGLAAGWEQAYFEAKRRREAGDMPPRTDVPPVFHLEVPRVDIESGRWLAHVTRFEDAGRRAALAACRVGDAVLDDSGAREPDLARGVYSWTIVLAPPSSAAER